MLIISEKMTTQKSQPFVVCVIIYKVLLSNKTTTVYERQSQTTVRPLNRSSPWPASNYIDTVSLYVEFTGSETLG